MGRGGASTPLITAVARSTLGQNRTRMYTGASHTNNNLSPDFPVSDHDHPDNRVQHQRDSSSEPTEVIVNDPQSQLVESWMKFRNGNWSAMSPWHGPPLGTIKFRCHPHPPPSLPPPCISSSTQALLHLRQNASACAFQEEISQRETKTHVA